VADTSPRKVRTQITRGVHVELEMEMVRGGVLTVRALHDAAGTAGVRVTAARMAAQGL
jgi:hypothetical protein